MMQQHQQTKLNLNLSRVIFIETPTVFSVPVECSCVLRIFFDRRAQLPTSWQGRAGARMSIRLVVAVLCIETLTGCARRPVAPLGAAVSDPIRSASNPLPHRTLRSSQSGPDCQFTMRGLGDIWIDADGLGTPCGSGHPPTPRSRQ